MHFWRRRRLSLLSSPNWPILSGEKIATLEPYKRQEELEILLVGLVSFVVGICIHPLILRQLVDNHQTYYQSLQALRQEWKGEEDRWLQGRDRQSARVPHSSRQSSFSFPL